MAKAGKRHTTRADVRAIFDQTKSAKEAEVLLNTIERLTHHISKLMKEAHGGHWRVQIEHEVGLIVVAKSFAREPVIAATSLKEAV